MIKFSNSSDGFAPHFKKDINRISGPLKLLGKSDTTLQQFQLQQFIKKNGRYLKFFKRINQVLIALIISAAMYLLMVIIMGNRKEIQRLASRDVAPSLEGMELATLPSINNWDQLQQSIARRNIFEPVAPIVEAVIPADNLPQEILQQVKIIGVMLDEAPIAIIMMVNSGQTVFVSKGDTIVGTVVKDILESKVILSYNGLELDLFR